jgi:hypothetical protein
MLVDMTKDEENGDERKRRASKRQFALYQHTQDHKNAKVSNDTATAPSGNSAILGRV